MTWLEIQKKVIISFVTTFIEAIAIQSGFSKYYIPTHTEAWFP